MRKNKNVKHNVVQQQRDHWTCSAFETWSFEKNLGALIESSELFQHLFKNISKSIGFDRSHYNSKTLYDICSIEKHIFLMKHWKSLMKFRTVCCVHFFLQTDWNNKIVAEAHDSDLFIRLTKSIFQSFLTRLFDCVASLAREMHSKPACLDTFSSVVLVASASRPTIVDIQTFISHKHFQYKKYGAKKNVFFTVFRCVFTSIIVSVIMKSTNVCVCVSTNALDYERQRGKQFQIIIITIK